MVSEVRFPASNLFSVLREAAYFITKSGSLLSAAFGYGYFEAAFKNCSRH